MSDRNILVVGVASHYFNNRLYKLLKENNSSLTFDIFNTGPRLTKQEILDCPFDNVFQIDFEQNRSIILNIRGVRGIMNNRRFSNYFKNIMENRQYDLIHLQSISIWFADVVQKLNVKIITTVWGSDFYRRKITHNNKIKRIFKHSQIITVATKNIKDDIIRFEYNTAKKIQNIKFGLEVFDLINKLEPLPISKASLSKKDELIVTIGYNRHPAQQHINVIKKIISVKDRIKCRLKLVIPFTYGPKSKQYLDEILGLQNNFDTDFELLTEFMSSEQVAWQCVSSDVMIQVQNTDAFSGSMQEYMYGGNMVITGKWLNYSELRDNKVLFEEIEDLDELGNALLKISKSKIRKSDLMLANQPPLYNLSSWEKNIVKWNSLYH